MSIDKNRPASLYNDQSDSPRANIGFGRLMSDAEVLDLLADYDVTPRAFFMKSPGGFSGTHRLSEESDV